MTKNEPHLEPEAPETDMAPEPEEATEPESLSETIVDAPELVVIQADNEVHFIGTPGGVRVSVQQWTERSTAEYALEHNLFTRE
jgi:hypothetical protein